MLKLTLRSAHSAVGLLATVHFTGWLSTRWLPDIADDDAFPDAAPDDDYRDGPYAVLRALRGLAPRYGCTDNWPN